MNCFGNCFKPKDSQHSPPVKPQETMLSRFCDFRHQSRRETPQQHLRGDSASKKYKQVYELSRKQCKYFQKNGQIRLNVKLKPDVCISEFDIVITKDVYDEDQKSRYDNESRHGVAAVDNCR